MSHELNPKDREQALQEAKKAIDVAVPIFADIARANLTVDKLNEQLEQSATVSSAVIELDGDYLEITEETAQKGTSNQNTLIRIERLMPIATSRDNYLALLSYSFSSDPSFRVIGCEHTTKDKFDRATTRSVLYDTPEDVQKFFSQIYKVDEHGVVQPKYSVVDEQKAEKIRMKHAKLLEREFNIRTPQKQNVAAEKQRFGSGVLNLFRR